MSATQQPAAPGDGLVIEKVNQAPPADKRALCDPARTPLSERQRFQLFCGLVSYNYLNDRATEWESTPEHALDWHERIHDHPLNVILAGRKHTKTTAVLCEILDNCQFQDGFSALYWANTASQVNERMAELEDMIEANTWLDKLHDGGEACGARQHKTFRNKSVLYTTWVTGAAEGGHVNMSIGDDPLKEIGGTPDEKIESWYSKVIEPMLNRGGSHVIVGTRKRPDDLYEILRTKNADEDWDLPSYEIAEYPAIREPWVDKYSSRVDDVADESLYTKVEAPDLAAALDVPGDTLSILWPEGRPAGWLKRKLGAMGVPYFVREFCMVFSQVEDAIIPRDHIDERCSVHEPSPDIVTEASPYQRTVIGVDPASTQGTDSSSFVVVGVRPSGVRDIIHVFNAESIDPSRFKSKIQELDTLYSPDTIQIESNGMQAYIVDDAVDFDRSLPITGATTTREKHSWETGIPRMAHRVAQGGYRFYRESSDHTEQLINGLTGLTMDNDKLVGHTPDPVSALYMCEQAIGAKVPTGTVEVGQQDVPDDLDDDEFRESELGEAVFGALDQARGGRR